MSKSFDSHFNTPLNNRHSRTPSFSSVLLDSIYRSLDDDDYGDDDVISDSTPPPSTTLLLPSSSPTTTTDPTPKPNPKPSKKDKSVNLKRAIMIDHWIDKQQDNHERLLSHMYCVSTRKSNRRSSSCTSAATPATSSSFSDSVIVAAGTGSCSEADFASCFTTPQLPPKIRTTFASRSSTNSRSSPPQPSTSRPFITRTKSRALKIYADLKKANQQPISPGAKIAGFLNSIFTGSNRNNSSTDRKQKPPPPPSTSTSNSSSVCSSASSFSRSCLSKSTAPSSSSSGNAESTSSGKRSVRFYPLSVIVGEDSRPCGHKFLYERSDSKPVRSVKSAKLTKLPNVGRSNPWYLRDKENELGGIDEKEMIGGGEGDSDEPEGYASSDLFELENMEAVGGRYGYDEELPVYGTTSLEKNKAIIANGFLL